MGEKLEPHEQFESRKRDHVRIALSPLVQTEHLSEFHKIQLMHEALPEIDFSEVQISTNLFGKKVNAPLFVSSMTAGHADSVKINQILAEACQNKKWMLGVGSQRKELNDLSAVAEWKQIRKVAPDVLLFGNIGITQLIQSSVDQIQRLVDSLQAVGLFVHTNPLQEALQQEGTPNFRGGLKALENICNKLNVPVVLKEVGCGFSLSTLQRLNDVGFAAVDVSGAGGTHWGRIETQRNQNQFGEAFNDWGISTLDSILAAKEANLKFQVWASGGVRTGLDAAKLLALGASMVGFAQPALKAALENKLIEWMENLEKELKVSLFCTGSINLEKFQSRKLWKCK